jgi:hypothetical protein
MRMECGRNGWQKITFLDFCMPHGNVTDSRISTTVSDDWRSNGWDWLAPPIQV